MAHLASELLADVRRKAMLPSATGTGFTDADLLAQVDAEVERLSQRLLSVNEEFFVTYADIPLVAGQQAYRLPDRNIGGRVRDITLLLGNAQLNMTRLEPEQLVRFTNNASGMPMAFYMEAGAINLVPIPSGGSATMRVRYYTKPSKLTVTTSQWKVIDDVCSYDTAQSLVDLTKTTATLNANSRTNWDAFTAAADANARRTVDIISARPPHEFLGVDCFYYSDPANTLMYLQSFDTTLLSVGAAWITQVNYVPISRSAGFGDYVCVAGYSPLIQLPDELYGLLLQEVLCTVLEQLNYREKLAAAQDKCNQLREEALRLLTPRVDGAPRKMRGLISATRKFGFFW